MIYKTFKFQLVPNKTQTKTLRRYCGCARFLYNWGLARNKEAYGTAKKYLTNYDLSREFTVLRNDPKNDWLSAVPYILGSMVLVNLDLAFKAFFRRVKQGLTPGYPKFKRKNIDVESFSFSDPKLKSNRIRIPKLGLVRFRQSRPLEGKPIKATIKLIGNKWYVCITTETIADKPIGTRNRPIGIDVGLKEFAVLSTGEVVPNPKVHKHLLRRYKHLQRKISRRVKGSKNRNKARKQFQKLNERIRNIRHNFQHTLSTRLVKNHDFIAVETLNISGMMKNHCLAFGIADAAWGTFLSMLEYKCLWYGKEFVKIPQFTPSSKTCSSCGSVKPMPLKERKYVCEDCGLVEDRDLNAAKNILAVGLTVSACGALNESVEAGISRKRKRS